MSADQSNEALLLPTAFSIQIPKFGIVIVLVVVLVLGAVGFRDRKETDVLLDHRPHPLLPGFRLLRSLESVNYGIQIGFVERFQRKLLPSYP